VLPEEDNRGEVSKLLQQNQRAGVVERDLSFGGDVKVSQLYPHDLPDSSRRDSYCFRPLLRGGPGAVSWTHLDGERREFVSASSS